VIAEFLVIVASELNECSSHRQSRELNKW